MALIYQDGFDHYGTAQAAEKSWNGTPFAMVTGRGFGGQAINVILNNPVFRMLPTSYTHLIFGAAVKLNASSGGGQFLRFEDSGSPVASLGIDSVNRLVITDSLGNVTGTGTTIIAVETWFYVELEVTCGSSGHAVAHLNGGAEIASSLGNYGTSINRFVMLNQHLGGDTSIDDVYIADTTGSAPQNAMLGNVRVETLYPVADGSYTSWTPKIAGPHYQMVNETLIDGDGSFNYDATPGDKDSYILETFIGQIFGAQLNIGARQGDATVRQIAALIKQGGTDYFNSTVTLSSDYVIYTWTLGKDPSGADWLAATINADEFGQKLIA